MAPTTAPRGRPGHPGLPRGLANRNAGHSAPGGMGARLQQLHCAATLLCSPLTGNGVAEAGEAPSCPQIVAGSRAGWPCARPAPTAPGMCPEPMRTGSARRGWDAALYERSPPGPHSPPAQLPACHAPACGAAPRKLHPGGPRMESLPEAVLIRILASIPAVDLVLVCRLVCCQWKNLVDGAALWILKCQQEGLTGAESEEDAENWQNFYFLSKKKRNLIKNPCGEEGFQDWGEVENGGDGWKIEELPGDFGKEFPSEEVHKYFVTSYEWCRKSQVIDLRAEGYWEELMDTTQPKVVVKDWYAGRSDAGCLYELCVKLLSENEDVLAEYKSDTIAIPQDSDADWTEISHTFSNYGPGVRFVRFEHGGQDTLFWKGWYGVRVTNSSVTVEP